ncbi:glycosyltransferase [Candidatus Saccharibacteria bacterium]|nr:glycosyltransferase [Candidatus Saccharibacteria bacterium]
MRIAITSDTYYPMTNGVAVFTHNLAKGLAARGHEVLVLVPSFRRRKYVSRKDGPTVFYLSSKRFPFYPDQIHKIPERKKFLGVRLPRFRYKNGIWMATNAWSEMKKALDEFQPDVIHMQMVGPTGVAAVHYARKNNVPLVSTGHTYPDNYTSQFKLLKPIKKPADAAVRAYMASFMKKSAYATMPTEMAIADLVPKNRKKFQVPVEALSNGVDLSEFKPGKPAEAVLSKYKIDAKKPRVVYVGRVDPEKSISNVIKAFSLVLSKVPEAEMLVVGEGIDKINLESLVADMGLSKKIRFLGKIMLPDLVEIYRCGTLFATASETETQGIVLIEAAAVGLPLVAVNAGAVGELCQNRKNGALCQPGDVTGISRAMVKILTDKKIAKEYSKASIEIAKKHDINHTLKRFEEIYQTAIETFNKA